MARNSTNKKKKAGQDVMIASEGVSTTERAGADTAKQKDSRKSSSRRNRNNRGKTVSSQHSTRSSSSFSKDPSGGVVSASRSTLVFPTNSASMLAFGNMTTTPGQDNFLENFNTVFDYIIPDPDFPTTTPVPQFLMDSRAKRTSNVMVLQFTHYFGAINNRYTDAGLAEDQPSILNPIEQAAVNLKQFIDTSFGTNTNYNPADLVHYLESVSAVFPLAAEIKRDLRLVYTYVEGQYPAFLPKGMFAALGILAPGQSSWVHGEGLEPTARNLRSYIDDLNRILIAFNRLPIPPELGIFGYNDDLLECFYADSPDFQTAQLYAFRNYETWIYDEDNSIAPALKPERFGNETGNRASIATKIARLSAMVNAISALRTDSRAMLQNLFNAYGSRETLQIPLLEIDNLQPIPIVYDERILSAIENAVVFDPDYATLTPQLAMGNGHLWGHLWMSTTRNNSVASMLVNLPLQFHKPFDSISHEDIGWALRFHTSMRTRKSVLDATTEDAEDRLRGYFADGFTGFAIIRKVEAYYVNEEGAIRGINYASQMTQDYANWECIKHDFSAAPITLSVGGMIGDDTWTIVLNGYDAHRDVELSYRLEDMAMHWVYLTQELWGADLNRNVTGSRMSK